MTPDPAEPDTISTKARQNPTSSAISAHDVSVPVVGVERAMNLNKTAQATWPGLFEQEIPPRQISGQGFANVLEVGDKLGVSQRGVPL